MFKQLLAPTVFVLAAASIAIAIGGEAPAARELRKSPDPAAAPSTPTLPQTAQRPPVTSRFGAELRPVPAALAAHIGLPAQHGLLVAALAGNAPPQLQAFDVIVQVNREIADLGRLDRAIARGKGLSLLLVRAGVEHRVSIAAASLPQPSNEQELASFLSSDTLEADHPFYQLAAFRELKEGYGSRAAAYRDLAGETESRSREVQGQARQQIEELLARGDAEVAAYTEAREAELLELIDGRFDAELAAPVAELRIDLAERLPQDRIDRTDAGWDELGQSLNEGFAERLVFETDEAELDQRCRKTFLGMARSAGQVLLERCQRPWREAVKEFRRHEERYASRYDENVAWTERTVEGIRTQLHERITCAFRRTREVFSQKLARRLREMEVPAPGEVEECLEDVRQQVDRMSHRFIRRTNRAFEQFDEQVERANNDLTEQAAAELGACEAALAGTQTGLTALLDRHFATGIAVDGSWQSRQDVSELADRVRAELADACNAGRTSARPPAIGLARAFTEHRVACEEAWNDLRNLLTLIHREAEANCWKIEGPHLDGRFPTRTKKPRAELTMVTD